MPPRSYMVTAVVLAVLVVVSLPLTLGFSIILWYWLFAMAACILAIGGIVKLIYGLQAEPWIGIALASPGVVWAADNLVKFVSHASIPVILTFSTAASLASLAMAAGALRLVETTSGPHPAFRLGYGLLAAAALLVGVGLVAQIMGWSFIRSTPYYVLARSIFVGTALLKYGAIIGAAVLITKRYAIEPWAGAAISLICAFMIFNLVRSTLAVSLPGDTMFWLQPVLMLVGGAAVWRMGSVLSGQAPSVRYAQG
ncbi:hypothetical protein IVB30_12995 [Bradyrhizobium sp. 200]|uniref:hypothetical protein n=1 Tax=Bradyrhizobium sp. 200 TaxID=2782665 RepID=UPI001FFF4D48|nr:hypothetical protein [Bradyrhizobium sp. 200]UPJ52185.1 hypothetical protein IVB30_12995 [Bradyrhizobium sp. 200]